MCICALLYFFFFLVRFVSLVSLPHVARLPALPPPKDYTLIDHLAHFDRERIPERVVHAKGAGAFGYFEVGVYCYFVGRLVLLLFVFAGDLRLPLFKARQIQATTVV